jgi:3-hydroxymyristoyl/3-hydroxydecanoyl-(acyl carrier protein) dehydratase
MMPFPPILDRQPAPRAAFLLDMDPGLGAFQGHFPDFPVLPGVVQVDWAARLGKEAFGPLGTFRGIELLKFQGLIQPGPPAELHLHWQPEKGALRFTYTCDGERKSTGLLLFE